jgi:site-specific DNA recombinase
MSLPQDLIADIKNVIEKEFAKKLAADTMLLTQKKRELLEEEKKLNSIEEKWIENKINHDTYERWYKTITANKISLNASIEKLTGDKQNIYGIIIRNLDKLENLGKLYREASTENKRHLIKLEFDDNLYYQNGMYRTPTMLSFLTHNAQIMRDKRLLDYEKKTGKRQVFPSSGAEGVRTLVQLCDKLCFLHAYFPIDCRDEAGWKPTLPWSLGTLFRSCSVPYKS